MSPLSSAPPADQHRAAPARRKGYLFGAIAAVVALAVAGCSSSGSNSDSSKTPANTDAPASSSSAAATGAPWKIGAIVDETGAGADASGGTADVLKAWVKDVNDAGGINGHKLDLSIKDDKSTPAGGLQAAKDLVSEKVIALVQGSSLVASAWAGVISKAGIPVVCGAPAGAPPYGQNKDFYPCVPNAITDTDLLVKGAVDQGKKTIGVISCVEAQACTAAADAMKVSGKKFGAKIVVQTTSFSSPSFAAPCLALKQAGAEAVFALGPPAVEFSIIDQCGQQNYKPTYIASSVSDKFLTNKNVSGFVGITEVLPFFADHPVANKFRAVMEKNNVGTYKSHPDTAMTIWVTGLLFQRVAELGKFGDNPTAKDVTAALDSLQNETVGGATAPLTFTNGNRAVTCGFALAVENGKFVTPQGTKPVCPSGP